MVQKKMEKVNLLAKNLFVFGCFGSCSFLPKFLGTWSAQSLVHSWLIGALTQVLLDFSLNGIKWCYDNLQKRELAELVHQPLMKVVT